MNEKIVVAGDPHHQREVQVGVGLGNEYYGDDGERPLSAQVATYAAQVLSARGTIAEVPGTM